MRKGHFALLLVMHSKNNSVNTKECRERKSPTVIVLHFLCITLCNVPDSGIVEMSGWMVKCTCSMFGGIAGTLAGQGRQS